mmetsp:Transcript_1611/g.2874  ORF Transcript_1611/g.2874 Transcript_1611/m.2874 type:complete len:268 (-) Transcript_1611:69-872(-)
MLPPPPLLTADLLSSKTLMSVYVDISEIKLCRLTSSSSIQGFFRPGLLPRPEPRVLFRELFAVLFLLLLVRGFVSGLVVSMVMLLARDLSSSAVREEATVLSSSVKISESESLSELLFTFQLWLLLLANSGWLAPLPFRPLLFLVEPFGLGLDGGCFISISVISCRSRSSSWDASAFFLDGLIRPGIEGGLPACRPFLFFFFRLFPRPATPMLLPGNIGLGPTPPWELCEPNVLAGGWGVGLARPSWLLDKRERSLVVDRSSAIVSA